MIGKRSAVLAAVVTAATLVPLAVFGGVSFAQGTPSASEYQYGPSGNQYGKKTICHHTHSLTHPFVTITISVSAWPAHQRHHDTEGACAPTAPTPHVQVHTVTTSAGNSGGHGNSGHHGKP